MRKDKLILYLFTTGLMLSCGNRAGKTVGDMDSLTVDAVAEAVVDKHSEAYIRQSIDSIYQTVGETVVDGEGNKVDYIHNPFNRDSAYCSQRYYALMREAKRKSDETGDLLYNYDYWVCGQDFSDDWSCKVAKVYEMTDTSALVVLAIHNFSDIETTIALRFERDDWYIDDFSPSKDGNDDKALLRAYIREGLEARDKAKDSIKTVME